MSTTSTPAPETPAPADRELARKLVCDLIDGPDGFNDPSSSKHPDLRPYRKSWIMAFTPTIAAANAALRADLAAARAEVERLTARAAKEET